MSIRTWAVTACLKTATSFLKFDRISSPNNLASDLVRHPSVIERTTYASGKGDATYIVVERGAITYLEPPSRDYLQYQCKTLTEFMRRYYAQKIDSACTFEMARLEMKRAIAGKGTIPSGEFISQRNLLKAQLTDRLENYLQSTTFKFCRFLANM